MNYNQMKNRFARIALAENPARYTRAREILQAANMDFSMYSCTEEIIDKLLNTANMTEKEIETLFEDIKYANSEKIDIIVAHDARILKDQAKNRLERFFQAFESKSTAERLFILMGETGSGKTYAVEQRFPDIIEYACNKALDSYSLCYFLANKDGHNLRPYETPFLKAVKNGEKVFLDEINDLPHDSLMLLQGLTDEKKRIVIGDEIIDIHPDFRIIGTMNPPSETDERQPLGDALLGRAVGYVLRLTDETIINRLSVSQKWIDLVRELHGTMFDAGLIDLRKLDYRDFQKFTRHDFMSQYEFKNCTGDVENIRMYEEISNTQEFQKLIHQIQYEMRNFGKDE